MSLKNNDICHVCFLCLLFIFLIFLFFDLSFFFYIYLTPDDSQDHELYRWLPLCAAICTAASLAGCGRLVGQRPAHTPPGSRHLGGKPGVDSAAKCLLPFVPCPSVPVVHSMSGGVFQRVDNDNAVTPGRRLTQSDTAHRPGAVLLCLQQPVCL